MPDLAAPARSSLEAAARVAPDDADFTAALEAIARLDDATWRQLLPVLQQIAAELAPRFRDVTSAGDLLGDLALLAYERWIAEWLTRARRREARGPLALFLRDRMRDRLREERRRQARRAALLEGAPRGALETVVTEDTRGVARVLGGSAFPAADEVLAANELRARAAAESTPIGTILALREAGLDQEEIARHTATSR